LATRFLVWRAILALAARAHARQVAPVLQKLAWVRRWLREQGGARLAYRATAVALFVLGVFFRSNRYWIDPIGLWADEASWARRLFRHSLTNFDFRPIGYMNVTQLAVHVHSDERTIRILSWVAGIASLFLIFDIGRQLFRSRTARLLCLAVVVFHPLLIDMAREFKPYSVEFCTHLGLVWLFLRWRARGTRAWFYALLSCSVLSFLFAYNIVFLFPAIFGLLGGIFLHQRAYRSLSVTILGALAALALIASVYFGVLRQMGSTDEGEKFWGGKYDVFYLANGPRGAAPQSHARWLVHKYFDLLEFPDVQRDTWTFPKSTSPAVSDGLFEADRYAWLVLHLVGLVALCWPGRRLSLVLLAGPLAVVMAFNWFGVWPFGPFRANTFLLGYYILIPMIGLDALLGFAKKYSAFPAAAGFLLILVPNLTIGFDTHARKHFFVGHSEMRTVLRRMKGWRDRGPASARAEKTYVLMDWYSCSPFEYYIQHSDSTRSEFGSYFVDQFEFDCTRTPQGVQNAIRKLRGKSFFAVVTDDRALHGTRVAVHKGAVVLDEERIRDTHDLYYATAR
jgi:hypothetical protein